MVPIMNPAARRLHRGLVAAGLALPCLVSGCASTAPTGERTGRPQVVVTSAVLGSVVGDVVGDLADVAVLMPNGADPHEWSPSAKDVERLSDADLVVDNGLGLEGHLQDPLREAAGRGVTVFTLADHITVRRVKAGEGVDPDDPDQAPGAEDPHLWMDPLTMRQWIAPLVEVLRALGVDAAANAAEVEADLGALDAEVAGIVALIPPGRRKLVTGHESMGYFAERYGFVLVGAVIPSVTSQAQASAGELAALADRIAAAGTPAVFTEIGTSAATVEAVARDTGTAVVELSTHTLPADGTYRSFVLDIANTVADALR